MTTLTTYPALEQTAGTIGESPAAPVYAVVGFDGSPPAIRALDKNTSWGTDIETRNVLFLPQ